MREEIVSRILKHARLFLERDNNIRSVAKITGWSKTTVHLDLVDRLPQVYLDLSKKVLEKIEKQKAIKHLIGGYATQQKWITKNRKADRNAK